MSLAALAASAADWASIALAQTAVSTWGFHSNSVTKESETTESTIWRTWEKEKYRNKNEDEGKKEWKKRERDRERVRVRYGESERKREGEKEREKEEERKIERVQIRD